MKLFFKRKESQYLAGYINIGVIAKNETYFEPAVFNDILTDNVFIIQMPNSSVSQIRVSIDFFYEYSLVELARLLIAWRDWLDKDVGHLFLCLSNCKDQREINIFRLIEIFGFQSIPKVGYKEAYRPDYNNGIKLYLIDEKISDESRFEQVLPLLFRKNGIEQSQIATCRRSVPSSGVVTFFYRQHTPIKPSVIVRLTGGLGDQLLLYATAKRVALENGAQLKIDSSDQNMILYTGRQFALAPFNIDADFASSDDLLRVIEAEFLTGRQSPAGETYLSPFVKEVTPGPMPDVFARYGNLIYMYDARNFDVIDSIGESLRDEFQIKAPMNGGSMELAEKIAKHNSVSIHVRRTDFVSFGLVLPVSYYYQAMQAANQLLGDVQYFVFSDDINWVKTNLHFTQPVTFVSNSGNGGPHEDFRLLSLCKHHIIANSSFSWWAAWLCQHEGKQVFSPRNYGANQLPIPCGWTGIEVLL